MAWKQGASGAHQFLNCRNESGKINRLKETEREDIMSNANHIINFADFNVEADKNGKRSLSAELLIAVLESNEISTLESVTVTEFAEAIVEHYTLSNTSVNGACQWLRGYASGKGFDWASARPVSAVNRLKEANAAMEAEIAKLRAELEAAKSKKK